ncbi:MAG: 4Fe-4S dicluster domain-containing protein, partial [Candidatus Bathyarchaeia archaeon]
LCTLCGSCLTLCPTGVVSVSDHVSTVKDECILCAACVKSCPTGARVWEAEGMKNVAIQLHTNCAARKEPQAFI